MQYSPLSCYLSFLSPNKLEKECFKAMKIFLTILSRPKCTHCSVQHNLSTSSLHLLTYLLTPRSRVLLEKLTSSQLVKKFPVFYGTRRFITAFTSARHLSLFRATSIHSILPIRISQDPSQYYPPIYAWVF